MSRGKHYFLNSLLDYSGQVCNVPTEVIKQRCTEILNTIFTRQEATPNYCNGGLYEGIAGVAYMCYYVACSHHFSELESVLLKNANNYINVAIEYAETTQRSVQSSEESFFLGDSGVWATGALIKIALGEQQASEELLRRYADMAKKCFWIDFLKYGSSDDLLVGRAGYLCGCLVLKKSFGKEIVDSDVIVNLCKATLDSGKKYVKERELSWPLMYAYYGTEYLGVAHGLSGILLILLSFDDFLAGKAEDEIKRAVNYVLELQQPNGNFPCATDEISQPRPPEAEVVEWCLDSPGIVYLMAKAYLQWKEDRYLQSCLKCGENVWQKGLLRKGPGICHGVAGNGYVFLLLYRLTNDPKHLHRALQFADFMFTEEFKQAQMPDYPYSLFKGLAGTVCFLVDLLQPEKAHFPFFDIF